MNLEDIAKKAGVSRSTVSRVINDDPNVSKRTRERVLAVIAQENFHPNAAARTLVTRRTEVIGVVIPTPENIFFTDNSYFPMLLAGLGEATRERNYALLLWLGEVTDNDERLINKISNHHLMDGLVIASLDSRHPLYLRLADLRRPFVMIDKPMSRTEQISYVSIDNVRAGELATEHLIRLGRRRIAHITGQMTTSDGYERFLGYKQALERHGLPFDEQLVHYGYFGRAAGYEGAKQLFAGKPDAVFAAGDTIAIGVLQAAHEARLRVPHDIALVGVDDIDVARTAIPQLTTVRQPVQRKGAAAAQTLIDLIEGKVSGPQHVLLPIELVIRGSCGALTGSQDASRVPFGAQQSMQGGDA